MRDVPNPHATSRGHAQSSAPWLDARYEANRAAYEAQARAVGFQSSWHVLDAGCGGGAYLPLLAELVGPAGSLAAFDLAPENVAAVERRLAGWGLVGRVEARIGSVVALPYPDAAFDAVWCANTLQYLSDAEAGVALAELRRVVRPGGLVAVKDSDATLNRLLPAPAALFPLAYRVLAAAGDAQAHGTLRTAMLPAMLRRIGLADVRRTTTLLEQGFPVPETQRVTWRDYLGRYAQATAGVELPAEDRAFWVSLRTPGGVDRILDDPEFGFWEGNTLAVGAVPVA